MIRPAHVLLLTLLACGNDAVQDSAEDPAEPDIQLLVGLLDFGEAEVGLGTESTYTFSIHNRGGATLHIQDFVVEDESAFTVTSYGEIALPPGESSWAEITFAPQENGAVETWLHVDSDDPDTPRASIQLLGEGLAPVTTVTPDSWSVEGTLVGCTAQQDVLLWNTGGSDLTVLEVQLDSDSLEITTSEIEDSNGHAAGLATIGPDQGSSLITLFHAPLDDITDTAFLTITTTDPQQPTITLPITADGETHGTETDSWEQRDGTKSDLIVAVDRTESMSEELERLPAALFDLAEMLQDQDGAFRIALVVHDDGCVVGGAGSWLTTTTSPGMVGPQIDAMLDVDGAEGVHSERAFSLWEAFLAETPSGGCNAFTLRDSAYLHLLGVSDDEEQSTQPWTSYLSLFQAYKPDPDLVVIHGLGGPWPSGCDAVRPYSGVYEASVETGGTLWSICDEDWSAGFEELAIHMGPPRSSFPLSATPVSESIEVRVDDDVTKAWSWSEDTNRVRFHAEHTPEKGSTVVITYDLQPECE